MTRQPTPAGAAIPVVRVRHRLGRWQWVCLLCGDGPLDLASPPPGIAADQGRAHHRLWHTHH